jgi:protein JSN1
MASRGDHHLNLNYLPQITATQPRSGSSTANTSPIDPPSGTARSPFGLPGSARLGAGSPSHEIGGRLYSKR